MRTLLAGLFTLVFATAAWAAPKGVCPDGRININEASAEVLTELKGVGVKKAAKIVADRGERGAYKTVAELTRVNGVGERSVAKWAAKITVDCKAPAGAAAPESAAGEAASAPLNVNAATAEQLAGIPGIGPKTAEGIVALRTKKKGFKALVELKEVKGIGDAKFEKIKKLLVVENPD